jgi:hypothetical protein
MKENLFLNNSFCIRNEVNKSKKKMEKLHWTKGYIYSKLKKDVA